MQIFQYLFAINSHKARYTAILLRYNDFYWLIITMSTKLSSTDMKILQLLQENAALTAAEIADQVNLSASPCWRRINRLENEGIIQRKVALLDAKKLGLGLVVFSSVSLAQNDEASLEKFEHEVRLFPEVVECYTVTGAFDYFLKTITKDIQHYETFMRKKLLQMPLVSQVHSNVAVTQIKYTTSLPLESQL